MIANSPVHATIPASDLDRARKFYEETLGFTPSWVAPGGVLYEPAGTRFLIYPTPSAGKAEHTVAGFEVEDLVKTIREMKTAGIRFEEYDFPELKTVDSIAENGPVRSAWFKDSEGNIIGLVQLPANRT